MILYLAGGVSGNLKPFFRNLYLAGNAYRGNILMDLYLAGTNGRRNLISDNIEELKKYKINILESFYYIDDTITSFIPYFDNFLLDSGAFTFINNSKNKNIDWQEYIDKYADYIIKNNIKLFFELDIDPIIGYEKVKEYRNYLEKKVGRQCIPVWHKSRGLEEWKKLTKEYKYVAIGGIVTKEITREDYKYFPTLLKIAKDNKCKVHGLGFTNLEGLKKYHFDSVDSTSWTIGNRFGCIYKFENNTIKKYEKPEGKRMKAVETAYNNFLEWIKFSNYADTNL